MTATSQNGWPALADGSDRLHVWTIPARTGEVRVRMRSGSAGFLLAHFVLWWSERLEPVRGAVLDDWGWAYRPVRGALVLSNHASGTAVDVNATAYPLGTERMPAPMVRRVRRRLRLYGGCVGWGGDYRVRKDQMHLEIARDLLACEQVARRLMRTSRGRRLLEANPSQRAVIRS
ncbi:M15 family metallopeptidase [Pimelobacter simplex]|uniref:M15 family metallopeptidase n=1 Tax=Nocardioides simplex TaxID=2045 RepID=UPI003AB0B7E5